MNLISTLRSCVSFLILFALCSISPAHEWTSSNGKFKIEAEFVAIKNGKVVLEKPDGSYISVPLDQISKKDIEYIESLTGKKVDENGSSSESDTPDNSKPKTIKLKGSKEGDPPGVVRDLGEQGWGVKSMAISGDGAILVAGKSDQMVAVYDLNEGSRLNITDRLEDLGPVDVIAISRDGKRVIAGGSKGLVKSWRLSPEGALDEGVTFAGHSAAITSLAISADGRFAMSGSADKTAKYWQVDTGKEFESFGNFKRSVLGLWMSENGSEGKATDGEALARIDLKTKKAVMTRVRESAAIQFAAFSPDGRYLAMNDTYAIRIWDIKTGKEKPALKSNEIQWTGAFTPDGERMISGASGILNVWEVKTQKRVGVLKNDSPGYIQALAVSPDGEHVAGCSSNSGTVLRLFRLPPK
ncbi:MAG: SHD1 domain-containing protein [Pirellulales bacterium]